jgi:amidase
MRFEEYRACDATELARLVSKREVEPAELLRLAIDRTREVEHLNAVITPMFDEARDRAAKSLSGPFAGVPFLLKDLTQEYAGVPCAMGNKALKERKYTPQFHAEIVNRWLAAGVVVLGRTNTPEFGAKAITEPEAWGATRNPWNQDRIPGGSSGGSAAAVAAGIVPFAGANDGGGSIRIPAACCGLFGLKPGRGRTPMGPEFGETLHGAVTNHVLTRSVRDSAAMLDAAHGPETASLFHIKPPEQSYAEGMKRSPGKLRIAFSFVSPFGKVDTEARLAVETTVGLLTSLGHEVEEATPDIDSMMMAQDFLSLWFVNAALMVEQVRSITGCDNSGFELDTLGLAALGRSLRADEYVASYQRCLHYTRQLGSFFENHDLFLTPTLAAPPARIGEIATPAWQRQALKIVLGLHASRLLLETGMVEKMAHENLKWVPFTQLANLTGVPAMSVPLHWCKNGLPLGVQFVGPHSSETRLLQLAAQLEEISPWFDRVPDVASPSS